MESLCLVSERDLRCGKCGELIALPGALLGLSDLAGNAIPIRSGDPGGHRFVLRCPNGHKDTIVTQGEQVRFDHADPSVFDEVVAVMLE